MGTRVAVVKEVAGRGPEYIWKVTSTAFVNAGGAGPHTSRKILKYQQCALWTLQGAGVPSPEHLVLCEEPLVAAAPFPTQAEG